ncbi:class I SAM-dependent methyltransferase [Candidatus Nomurabacteria bacterium]|nr:class I SAM-dependent methyltransferase [Candidatus Nomurabacteria bacterium]
MKESTGLNIGSPEKLSGKEKLTKILDLAMDLHLLNMVGGVAGTEDYTLVGNPVGFSSRENSPMASIQLEFALAMSMNPKVKDLAALLKPERNRSEIELEMKKVIESRVLSGMKFLDLGCGCSPTFARVARAAGADVYTVDIVGSDEFEYFNKVGIDPNVLEKEVIKHIQLDLNNPNAQETINKLTGGNFDLVTSAHLQSGCAGYAFHKGKEIAYPLLKSGGIYFDANAFAMRPGKGGAEVKE